MTGATEIRVGSCTSGRCIRARVVRERCSMGREPRPIGGGATETAVRCDASGVAKAMQTLRNTAASPILVSAVHHLRAFRYPQDHWSLHQLCAVYVPGNRPAQRALDQTRSRPTLSA